MACFDDVVALKELCTEAVPFSGIYLNDVGITKAFIEQVITSDYQTPGEDAIQEFVTSKKNQAIRIIKNAIHGKYGNRINSTSLITDHRLGYTQNNLIAVAGGDYKGIQLTLNNSTNHVNANISSVSLQVNVSGNVDILIYDLFQNKLLATLPITAVSGEIVTIYPHTIIESYGRPLNLFIGYNATGITSVQTYIRDGQCCGITSCTTSFMTAKGVTNSTGTFTQENMTQINHTAGLSVTYSLVCDSFSWMCDYAQVLALPIAYKTASEMYLHAIQNGINQRSSNNTNLNVEQIKETQGFYELQYREQLDAILSNMNLPRESVCFQCKTPARTAVVLP
jgi:hypothetical protein